MHHAWRVHTQIHSHTHTVTLTHTQTHTHGVHPCLELKHELPLVLKLCCLHYQRSLQVYMLSGCVREGHHLIVSPSLCRACARARALACAYALRGPVRADSSFSICRWTCSGRAVSGMFLELSLPPVPPAIPSSRISPVLSAWICRSTRRARLSWSTSA